MTLEEKDLKYIWHPCSQMKDYEELPPIIIDRGKGIYLYDKDGKEYIDIVSSWWCNLLGHCNEKINANIITFDGKAHCEDALINSEEHINVLNKILRER